ncbi:MoaD/ThiS family protein [Thermoanaerobacter mathranii]|uniref:MoaD/ThiS family protein n=1 Tax=Thermoanaerobacter mathranii TaxID=583357 RepID=UPI003AAB303C
MTIIFVGKNNRVTIKGAKSVEKLAKELNISLESHVFVKNGEIVTPDEILQDEDTVEVISVISGG